MKILTSRWHLHCYPAGTSPSAGDLCSYSGTERSSLESPSAPTQHLAFGAKIFKKKPFTLWIVLKHRTWSHTHTFLLLLLLCRNLQYSIFIVWKMWTFKGWFVPEAESTQYFHSHSLLPASRRSVLLQWWHLHSLRPQAGDLRCCRGRCKLHTLTGSILQYSCHSGPPPVWKQTRSHTYSLWRTTLKLASDSQLLIQG